MASIVLRLLYFSVLFPSLAFAQTMLPIVPPKAAGDRAAGPQPRAMTARSSISSPSSRLEAASSGYRSAIANDASQTPGFAGFYSAPFYPSISSSTAEDALLGGDFNHDGKPDLLSLNFDSVAVLLNDGAG